MTKVERISVEKRLNIYGIGVVEVESFWNFFIPTVQYLSGGMLVTGKIFLYTLVLSIPLGFLISLLRISKFKVFSALASVYIWELRGTPLLLQIFFVYYGLPYLNLFGLKLPSLDNFTSAIIAFVLNYAAYFAEIFRAGIASIDKGQYEGAKALGYTYWQTMRRIIIPQMARVVLPPISNETITLVKDTSLVSVVALEDVMRLTNTRVSSTASVAPFGVAAVFYLLMTLILTVLFNKLDKRYNQYE